MKLRRGQPIWFWYAHRRVQARVHRVKGDTVVVYLNGQRVQIPQARARRIRELPDSVVGEG